MSNNLIPQTNPNEPQSQKELIPSSTNLAKILEANGKHHRPSEAHTRLILTGDQTKQLIRSARSGSVKQKLNLENTRLKINVENLSSLISVHQNNEAKFRLELDRYKQKVLRYKEKIKQKDTIIAKLLQKLERKIQIDGGSLQNLILKLHEQHIKGFKSKINRGETVEVSQILSKYEQLLKGFNKQQKQRLYLQKQKQDLQKTVKELKETIKYVGEGKGSEKQSEIKFENQRMKIKLGQLQSVLQKEKNLRNTLIQSLKVGSSELQPEIKAMIVDVERQRAFISQKDQTKKTLELSEQVSNLKQKLAQSEANLFNQREVRKGTQKHCNFIQQQLQDISKKMVTCNFNVEDLNGKLEKIQQTYSKQLVQLQEKTNALLDQSTNLQQYKSHVDETSKKFSDAIHNFAQQSIKWATLENQYQQRIDQLRNNKRYLQDRLQKETQKRRLFELKLMGEDEDVDTVKNVDASDEQRVNKYLDERVDVIRKQSLKNKKENENLSEQLTRGKRAFQILQRQLKDADEKIFKLQQILKTNKIPISSSPTSLQRLPETDSQNKLPQAKEPKTQQQYVDAYNDLKTHNVFLENQIKQMRSKYIDMQMDLEQAQNQIENKQIENARILQNSRRKDEQRSKGHSGKILAEGQPYLQKSSVQGGYKVNIINVNDMPAQIQKMQFEELANRYLQVRDELIYLKQKMQQGLRENVQKSTQSPQKKKGGNLEMILSENENEPEEGTSQSVDEETYKNINQQMDRLIMKNKDLQQQLSEQKLISEEQIQSLSKINNELKEKLRSAEEINTNLSNIVVHLQAELSRYQNNYDSSVQEQRGSDVMEASGKSKIDGKYYGDSLGLASDIEKKITQKKKEFQQMLKSGQSQGAKQSKQYQTHLKALQLQIRSLQQQQKQSNKQKSKAKIEIESQKQIGAKEGGSSSECSNCQTLTKLSSELVNKLQKIQEAKQQKIANFKTQLELIQPELPETGPTPNIQDLVKENTKLRQLVAEIKTQLNYDNRERQEFENQIKNLREINEQLVSSIHEKQKAMLKIRTDLYRQNFDKLGIDEGSAKKIQDIFESYQKKIDDLESIIKGQQKNEVNISDLYDTINYLNAQCQNLRKTIQQLPDSKIQPQHELNENLQQQIPNSVQQLTQKYKQLSVHLQNLAKKAEQSNFKNINQMLENAEEQRQKNIQLMKENNKLQNKIVNMNAKYEEYFKKINEGKTYQIIQDKDKEIDGIKEENAGFKNQLDNLQRERRSMFEQNQKINQDLKNIQDNIQKLTGGKVSLMESTLPDHSQLSKSFEKLPAPKDQSQKKISAQQSQYILENLTRKIELFKKAVQNSSHKIRPSFQIQSFQQLPSLEDTIIILLDRLHYTWNLVEQRTTQYNELRDQMNIISMECMKNGQFQIDIEKSRESQNKIKQAEIIEQRYQEVLAELVQYETQNKRLEKQVNRLKQQLGVYKRQVEEVHSKYVFQLRSESSEDLPYNKQTLNRLLESSSLMVTSNVQKQLPEIIKLFLARIKELQGNLQSIQNSFDQKNRKLESLINKQKSFISQKSRVRRDESEPSQNSQSRNKDSQFQPEKASVVNPSARNPNMPVSIGDEKSYYSMNSVKIFKQIEQLTKNNEQLREKNDKYISLLQSVSKNVQNLIGNKSKVTLEEPQRKQLEKLSVKVNSLLQEEGKRENSGFDLEHDQILGAGFSQKGNQQIDQKRGLEQVQDSLQGPKSMTNLSKSRNKQEQANKKTQLNIRFLDENKFLFQELFNTFKKLQKSEQSIDGVKSVLASKLSDRELQEILYLTKPEQAVAKIVELVSQHASEVNKISKQKEEKVEEKVEDKDAEMSIEQGEWVETAQLEAIINEIYPTKTQLCLVVANSINMLMMAVTKQGILKAVQFLFTNLRNKQNEFKQQMKRRDESVTEYGRKLQKLLASKYSEDQSQQKSEMLNQNSFRRAAEIKSQNQIKGEAHYPRSKHNFSSSEENSQSYSRITYEK